MTEILEVSLPAVYKLHQPMPMIESNYQHPQLLLDAHLVVAEYNSKKIRNLVEGQKKHLSGILATDWTEILPNY